MILLVEDTIELIEQYKRKFEFVGYAIDVATTGKEAIEKLNKYNYELVLLDILLPEMTGLEFLQKKEVLTPVIIITNLGLEAIEDRCREYGVIDFLVKSNNTPQMILERVQRFFNKGE